MTKQSKSSGNKNESAEQPTRCQTTDRYEVGFKKPPKNNQFKKGMSGNPGGRPLAKRNLSKKRSVKATFLDVFAKPVKVTIGGKLQNIDGIEGAFLQLRAKALAGDHRALRLFIDLCKYFEVTTSDEPNAQLKALFDSLNAGPVDTP
jgi:hypothetical protein